MYSLGKLATGYLCKLQLTTVQSGFKWWGENPEKAPNPARQLWSLGHWWSSVVTGQESGQRVGYHPAQFESFILFVTTPKPHNGILWPEISYYMRIFDRMVMINTQCSITSIFIQLYPWTMYFDAQDNTSKKLPYSPISQL